ncbi:purine-nucleoside phosphorylase [Bacilli bacterium PM5-3]|nr:purine-nucleoside phosphorylase [Bacilli bacterium PM5-3]MDH6603327.1 purine-nucleoside phosphorylase [Bacilli bacterium PM5-9]
MNENIKTAHINPTGKIAKTVLMPGDPLRAKYIADTFLENVVQFNSVRGMLGYTGTYNGKEISVMGSGMGMPSIGIYSYELFDVYGVENIIRIGSAGAYTADLNLYDVILATECFSESTFAKVAYDRDDNVMKSSLELNDRVRKYAKDLGIDIIEGRIHSSDVFYNGDPNAYKNYYENDKCLCAEMESFALFANADKLGKKATCLVTISDSIATGAETTSEERQTAFNEMMKIALEFAE